MNHMCCSLYEKEKTSIYKDAVVWRDFLRNTRFDEAVVIVESSEWDLNVYMVELLPLMMKENRYKRIVVLSSRKEVLQLADEKEWEFVETLLCTADMLYSFNHLGSGLNMINRVYTNLTEELDEDNPLLLSEENGLTRREIVARAFLGIRNYSEDSIQEPIDKSNNRKESIDWNKQSKFLPLNKYTYLSVKEYIQDYLKSAEQHNQITSDDKLVIYGVSRHAYEMINIIRDRYDYYIVDADERKQGQTVCDSIIYSPAEILKEYDPRIKVFVMIYHYQEVCEYLLDLGYVLGEQVFILNYKDDIVDFDDYYLEKRIDKKLKEGYDAYCRIRESHSKEYLFISPLNGTGDIYMAGMYLPDYLKREGIGEFCVIVPSNTLFQISQLFGFKTIIVSQEEAFAIINYARLVGYDKLRLRNINVCVGNQRINSLLHRIDFNAFHQKLIYRDKKKRSVAKMNQCSSEGLFVRHRLKKGKTILLSPYSKTEGNLPEQFCEQLAERLKDRGYCVCTNAAAGENPVKGTIGLCVPYSQLLDFIEKAGFFIGVRSGLCDIISSTISPMVVFYKPEDRFIYDLEKMGYRKGNTFQMTMEEIDSLNTIEEIMFFLETGANRIRC